MITSPVNVPWEGNTPMIAGEEIYFGVIGGRWFGTIPFKYEELVSGSSPKENSLEQFSLGFLL